MRYGDRSSGRRVCMEFFSRCGRPKKSQNVVSLLDMRQAVFHNSSYHTVVEVTNGQVTYFVYLAAWYPPPPLNTHHI